MIVKVNKSQYLIKIKYVSNNKTYIEKITDERTFEIDKNTFFTITKYDSNFDTKYKILLYSIKMILFSVILMVLDSFGDIQDCKSFFYISYRFRCDSNCTINADEIESENFDKKKSKENLFNAFYLISSFLFLGIIIFIIGSIIYKK